MPALTQSARDYENALIQNRQLQAAVEAARLEKARFDVEKAQEETLAGRVALGERIAMINERDRQAKEGVAIGPDISRQVLESKEKGGIGLLAGSQMQAELDLRNRMEQGRLGAIQQYGIERGAIPTAKVDVGGVSQTVPATGAAAVQADLQAQVYNATWPRLAQVFESQGFSPQDAERMGKDAAAKELIKNANSGKINLLLQDGSTLSVDFSRAMQMAKDPTTAPAIRSQLISVLGETEAPKAPNWVKTRLGR